MHRETAPHANVARETFCALYTALSEGSRAAGVDNTSSGCGCRIHTQRGGHSLCPHDSLVCKDLEAMLLRSRSRAAREVSAPDRSRWAPQSTCSLHWGRRHRPENRAVQPRARRMLRLQLPRQTMRRPGKDLSMKLKQKHTLWACRG